MKIRIKFSKLGNMKFVGHLDIMRYFQKAMRRADIDIAYTGGFSPHQKMSFAAPLGVGLTSRGEYFDIEANSSESSKIAVQKLNAVMVEGMEILSYGLLPDDAGNAMSSVAAADYLVRFREGYCPCEDFNEKFLQYLHQDTIVVLRKSKKSEALVNIRPWIYRNEMMKETDNPACEPGWFFQLAAGSENNLKPELIFQGFCEANNLLFDPFALLVERLEIYGKTEKEGALPGGLLPLEGFAAPITEPIKPAVMDREIL